MWLVSFYNGSFEIDWMRSMVALTCYRSCSHCSVNWTSLWTKGLTRPARWTTPLGQWPFSAVDACVSWTTCMWDSPWMKTSSSHLKWLARALTRISVKHKISGWKLMKSLMQFTFHSWMFSFSFSPTDTTVPPKYCVHLSFKSPWYDRCSCLGDMERIALDR